MPRFGLLRLFAIAVSTFSICAVALADEAAPNAADVDFVRDIRPIFVKHCYECHGPKSHESGLKLNTRAAAFAGGDTGEKAIVPGKPDESRLLDRISGRNADEIMPPKDAGESLSASEVELVRRWIAAGAVWPADADTADAASSHWAWIAPVQKPLPSVKQHAWIRNAIDAFVLARLEQEGFSPTAEADRYTLIRRVHLDLIGLPPSLAEVDQFVADQADGAYERMVDRALANPAYGERWARVWLDLARYADSKGYGSDPLRTIWRYRDWVIDAFNRNLPYNQFTIEQIAGDLLPGATTEQILATAFHRNTMANDEGGTDDEEFRVAAVKDRAETTAQVWMGLTLGCAKCHSHKFDPLTQKEYYQMYAFFNQTEDADRGDESPRLPTPTAEQQRQDATLRDELTQLRQQLTAPQPQLAAAQAAWETSIAAGDSHWTVLSPAEFSAEKGTVVNIQPDKSLLASGLPPETDVYRVTVDAPTPAITALRVEVLPDASLPAMGPGRQSTNGTFVINDLRIAAVPRETKAVRGRYVRIELAGENKMLSLAEVQVFRGGQNVATFGKASQSSTDYEGHAQLAIDGNTSGAYMQDHSVTHTKSEANPWWELDLGAISDVDQIVIWNRTDAGVGERLAGFRVLLLDKERQTVWHNSGSPVPNPSVTLELRGASQLAIAEATADFEQSGWPVRKAIDGSASAKSGWAISPQTGKPHEAVFALAKPTDADTNRLLVTITQSYGTGATVGRLRISATTLDPPPRAVPASIRDIARIASSERTAEQSAALAQYFNSIAPELKATRDRASQLETQLKELEKQIVTTPVMRELAEKAQRKTTVMIKGNFLVPGDPVAAAVPAAFHKLPDGVAANRLGLARWLVDPANPLTARVAVNRFWAQLFGQGIVASEEDFGTQGLPPSHPELLDWLALEYQRLGWDSKALLKLIVTSATYRQSSSGTSESLAKDPYNRLLGRGARFRLEAEMVRDQALSISGLLSHKIGGQSVYPPQPDGLWRAAFNGERTWATSSGEDRYRRGLYTFWRRTVPYPSMATFDAPSREICTMRRISTNTPLQALVTLNDVAFVEAAQALARRIVREAGSSLNERAAYGLRLALARPATAEQTAALVKLYEQELERYHQDAVAAKQIATEPLGALAEGQDPAEMAAWTVAANVILNLDGLLTKR